MTVKISHNQPNTRTMNMEFQPDQSLENIIKVIGVGGGGGNAVNYMFKQGIEGVDFFVCNTDIQALRHSSVPNRIQLGAELTSGLGAGSSAKSGADAAVESTADIENMLSDGTRMIFITAGFGGGTGTGAAPVIAEIAKKMGILTVGIVTLPFSDEGPDRQKQATEGLENLRPNVDALITISNDRIVDMYGDLTFLEAFEKADDVLCTAARGIAEIIFKPGHMNVDFKDVETAMQNSGRALMSTGVADGENRAHEAVQMAIKSPLLDNTKIIGANHILLNVTYGNKAPTLSETRTITSFLQEEAGNTAHLKMGITKDETLEDKLSVTVIATGFEITQDQDNDISPRNGQSKETIEQLAPMEESDIEIEVIHEDPIQEEEPNEANSNVSSETNTGSIHVKRNQLEDSEPLAELFSDNNPNQHSQQGNSFESEQYAAPQRQHNIPSQNPLQTSLGFGNNEMDIEIPAYQRRNVQLAEAPPSHSSNVSKLSISDKDENENQDRFSISPNKMLHDNVD